MRRLLTEPLFHFLVLGALLFGIYAWMHHADSDQGYGPVRITSKDVAYLAELWQRQQERPPTHAELHALVTGYLKEELLGREARAMGLDQDDLIIRRRLAQKVEFIVEDTARLAQPTQDDLRRFYDANRTMFQTRSQISFTQVFFDPKKHQHVAVDVQAALVALSRGGEPAHLGDPAPLDATVRDEDMQAVEGLFGQSFANAVFSLTPGAWRGPISSSFGLHLVRVAQVQPARQLEFSEAEPQVRESWLEEHQREIKQQYYAGLLKKYDVSIDANLKPVLGSLSAFSAEASTSREANVSGEGPAR